MYLQSIQLLNFKNYREAAVDFSPKINVLVGKNGSGKTNLLDAIHVLSMTRSAFSADNLCVRHGESYFFVQGVFRKADRPRQLTCSVQSGTKKAFREDGIEYNKLADHIGKYPVVLITPDDTQLIREASEERRRFFDSLISQIDRPYLDALIRYNHALRQRNSLLKIFSEKKTFDAVALDTYDEVLIESGKVIFERRRNFTGEFLPVFGQFYEIIVQDQPSSLVYKSDLDNVPPEHGLALNRQRDILLQRTSFGVHRDDYLFTFAHGDLKKLGSQGQQKSFILALKLAQFRILQRYKDLKPVMLLDDVFDKLDDERIRRLLELIHSDEFGQLFITDARPDRTSALLREISAGPRIFTVEKGQIKDEQPQKQE